MKGFELLHCRFLLAVFSALLAFLAGCGHSDGRQRVYGTVLIGNEPIRGGFVIIEPASVANSTGRQGRATIRDGRFDTLEGGENAVTGPVVIRIQGCGAPSSRYPNGVPVCHDYAIRMELAAGPNELELKVPESAKIPPPKEGKSIGP